MALHRGIQSAIFYYVSCAPCAEARYRKKRKQEAKRDRAERDALDAELPDLYRHPSPSSTNPYWHADIALGPARVRGKRKATSAPSRAVTDAVDDSHQPSEVTSSVDLPPDGVSRRDGHWTQALHQREDEALWGSTASLGSAAAHVQRPPRAKMRESPSSSSRTYRNPAVNDQHPATVTRVDSPNDVAWMMQPPPPPAVMSGKEPPSKATSMAGSSRLSPQSMPMSRQASSISERMLARERALSQLSRDGSHLTSTVPTSQWHGSDVGTAERDFAFDSAVDATSSTFPATKMDEDHDLNSAALAPPPRTYQRSGQTDHRTALPPLWTVVTDSAALPHSSHDDQFYAPSDTQPDHSSENTHPRTSSRSGTSTNVKLPFARHSAVLVQDKQSLKLVQDLSPTSAVRVYTTTPPARNVSMIRHAWDDSGDASPAGALRPELFETWYKPDFELPQWVHEHTKREVRERWSMDL